MRQLFKDASVTIARDVSTFQKELPRHRFDAVVIESQGGQEQIGPLNDHLDPSRTLCIRGSKAVLKKTLKTIQLMNQPGSPQQNKARDAWLDGYLEGKMGGVEILMRIVFAKNLHLILI